MSLNNGMLGGVQNS